MNVKCTDTTKITDYVIVSVGRNHLPGDYSIAD